MKRAFLFSSLFAFALGGLVAQAQELNPPQTSAKVGIAPVQQGNWMIGGSLGSLGYSFEGKAFNVNIEPSAAYFVSDGIAVGARLIGGLTAASGQDNEWHYGVAPMVRYFFPEGSTATGRFFAQGDVGIAGSSIGSDVSLLLGAGVGYAHFVTNSVALEASLGDRYNKANISTAGSTSGLNVGVGFQIYLPGQR